MRKIYEFVDPSIEIGIYTFFHFFLLEELPNSTVPQSWEKSSCIRCIVRIKHKIINFILCSRSDETAVCRQSSHKNRK